METGTHIIKDLEMRMGPMLLHDPLVVKPITGPLLPRLLPPHAPNPAPFFTETNTARHSRNQKTLATEGTEITEILPKNDVGHG